MSTKHLPWRSNSDTSHRDAHRFSELNPLRRLLRSALAWYGTARQVSILSALDDQALRDVGISRNEVGLYRPPSRLTGRH
ncbi:hypothetical protein PTE30175_02710 [Pandoraea terrae]|uniref:YjiS-like domain-containing protein n=1 Tax=Pandoraea terrae TaxID=1537710 RepID=A0A5E4VPI0_9BURK|nr:hypothetical protein PTE30175_02710 [Pandoraea terrae]